MIGTGSSAVIGDNHGIELVSSSSISSTGTTANAATITLTGNSGIGNLGTNDGIRIDGSDITSANGDITLTGISNATTGGDNRGILLISSGQIEASSDSTITIVEASGGPATSTENDGLHISGATGHITSADGDIIITLARGRGSGNSARGIAIEGEGIKTTGGSITITAANGSAGGGTTNHGLHLNNAAAVIQSTAGASKSISITATGGSTSGSGVFIEVGNITSTASSIDITGTLAGTGIGIDLATTQTIGGASATGAITLTTDNIQLAAGGIVQSTGILTIKPKTAVTLGIGSAATGVLNLTDAELGTFTDGFSSIILGDLTNTTDVDVDITSFTFLDPLTVRGNTVTVNSPLTAGSGNNVTLTSNTFVTQTTSADTITGDNITINIGQGAAGTLNLNANILATTSTSFNGAGSNDTFNINITQDFAATLAGGGGTNTLVGPVASNCWILNSSTNNAGTLKMNSNTNVITFTSVQKLEGNSGADEFVFSGTGSRITGSPGIDGKAGLNRVTGADGITNEWTSLTTSGDNTGSINPGGGGATSFINIRNLDGGTGIDNFTFGAAGQFDGAIDAKAGVNTITAFASAATWTLTASDTGSLLYTGPVKTTNFTKTSVGTLNLTGSSSADSFVFSPGGSLSGAIDGGAGGSNSLTSNYAEPTVVTFSVSGGAGSLIVGGFDRIQTVTGSVAEVLLQGSNNTNTWTLSAIADDAGTLAYTSGTGAQSVAFSQICCLKGGSGADTFTFSGPFKMSNFINGGSGTDNTMIATTGVANEWAITADNAGSMTPSGGTGATTFSIIQNLTGGNSKDTFVLSNGKGLTGILIGGSACAEGNVLDYSAYTTPITSSMPPCSGITGTATNILGGIQFISETISPEAIIRAFEAALVSELLITYDLKRFVEFNSFLLRYKFLLIEEEEISKDKIKLFPEFLDKVYKDEVKNRGG